MQRLPLVLASLLALVLAFAIGESVYEDVVVAPWAESGSVGRLHPHAKNVTRVGGGPDAVRRAIVRAVDLDTTATPSAPTPAGWQQLIVAQIRPAPRPSHVVALAGEGVNAAAWALPGAYWAAYAGVPVVFVDHDSVSSGALQAIRGYNVPVYLLAPQSLVSDNALAALSRAAPTVRVAGDNLAAHAIAIAEYRDQTTDFGWGRTHGARTGYFDFVVSAPSEVGQARAALPLARCSSTEQCDRTARCRKPPLSLFPRSICVYFPHVHISLLEQAAACSSSAQQSPAASRMTTPPRDLTARR